MRMRINAAFVRVNAVRTTGVSSSLCAWVRVFFYGDNDENVKRFLRSVKRNVFIIVIIILGHSILSSTTVSSCVAESVLVLMASKFKTILGVSSPSSQSTTLMITRWFHSLGQLSPSLVDEDGNAAIRFLFRGIQAPCRSWEMKDKCERSKDELAVTENQQWMTRTQS